MGRGYPLPRAGGRHDHHASLASIFSGRRASDYFHGLDRIDGNLIGKGFARLVSHRLPVNRKRILRMIAISVNLPIGIGSDTRCRQPNQCAHRRRPTPHGKFVDQFLVDIGMKSRIILHQIARCLHRNRRRRSRYLEIDLDINGHDRADHYILCRLSKSLSRHRHVIGIKRHVGETESPLTVCSRLLIVAGDRIMNLDACIRNHRARRVQDGPADRARTSARLRIRRPNPDRQCEGHHCRRPPVSLK